MTTAPLDKPMAPAKPRLSHNAVFWIGFCVVMALLIVAPMVLPVFWACGVTPQSVIAAAKPEFCITHYPGSMLVTDRRNTEFAIL